MNDVITCCTRCKPLVPLVCSDGEKEAHCPKCGTLWKDIKAEVDRAYQYREENGF